MVYAPTHGDSSIETAARSPTSMLMALLQRVVNGGGRIEREYGLGRGALDLLVDVQGKRHVIEVKLRRDTQTEKRSLEQVARYLDTAAPRLGVERVTCGGCRGRRGGAVEIGVKYPTSGRGLIPLNG